MSTILDHIHATPLLRLDRLAAWAGVPEARILAKAEHLNPGGSCKDRTALALVDAAVQEGLRPGQPIVEATSGNTGISLAQICAVRGHPLHVVASEKVSREKVRIIEAFGGTVHCTPVVPHGHPDHYTEVAPRLANQIGGWYLRQFEHPANTDIHATHTGPELIEQCRPYGPLDAFVAGVGTGGTLSGIARALATASPETRILLADPEGSILADPTKRAAGYQVEGIGDDAFPELYEQERVAGAYTVSDARAFEVALACARLEGLFVGGSAGAHLAACIEAARDGHQTIATVLPDTGRNYLSTFFDPAWCGARGLGHLHARLEVAA